MFTALGPGQLQELNLVGLRCWRRRGGGVGVDLQISAKKGEKNTSDDDANNFTPIVAGQ